MFCMVRGATKTRLPLAALAAASPEVVIGQGLSEAQRPYAEEARDRLVNMHRIREEAKELPHPRLLQVIDACLHQVQQQTLGG